MRSLASPPSTSMGWDTHTRLKSSVEPGLWVGVWMDQHYRFWRDGEAGGEASEGPGETEVRGGI